MVYTFALITVATPARDTRQVSFSLQLQGPFSTDMRAEFSPIYRSLAADPAPTRPLQCICIFYYGGLYAKGGNCQVATEFYLEGSICCVTGIYPWL